MNNTEELQPCILMHPLDQLLSFDVRSAQKSLAKRLWMRGASKEYVQGLVGESAVLTFQPELT